jgi:hypothetical protein
MAHEGNLATPLPHQSMNDTWAALEKQSELLQLQAIVSLKSAKGVPTPFEKRNQDVVRRKVRVCLFDGKEVARTNSIETLAYQDLDDRAQGCRPQGRLVGNIHEVPVAWSKSEEDIWDFSKSATKADDYKFIVRRNCIASHIFTNYRSICIE